MKDLNEMFAAGNLESEDDLSKRITEITTYIHEAYPELAPYISEIPITIPNDPIPEVNNKVLKDYYDYLYQIVKNHVDSTPKRNEENINKNDPE
jgi:hypothetical protein